MLAAAALGALIGMWAAPSPLRLPNRTSEPANAALVLAGATSAPAIELGTYQQLLAGRSENWRAIRLAENPNILVIEFPNLAAQGKAFNRLAALIEKHKAPRDRLLSAEGLASFIHRAGDTAETFYFGHNYRAEAVARFFNLSVSQQEPLNPEELRLGNLLVAAKLLTEAKGLLVANPSSQAVVSFTALQADRPQTPVDESVDALRREAILRHELSHGEFFTNAAYRDHCWAFWRGLSDSDRSLFRNFLASQGYDPQNEELMVNEAQAYLKHTPDERAFNARLMGIAPSRLDAWRARFRQQLPPTILSAIER